MRCPGPILAGSKHTSKALDSALGEAYPEAEEVETEPEAEDRAREDVRPARTPLPDGRMECEFCGRKFNPASYERHQPICQKVFGGTRPQFLSSQVSKGSDRARAANRGGGPVGQGSNGHSPRSPKAPTQRSQPGHSSPRGSAGENPGHGKNAVAKPQRTPTGPEPCHGSDVPRARQDSQELEQRVMRVMSDQMEELRNLRQQVREEPESHGKVEKDSAAVGKAGDSTGACAPKPQERARRAPKSPTNPEERLLPQPKKAAVEDRIPKSPVLSESAPCRSLVSAAEMQLIPCEDCGRRFNPASLEKHRAVCRNVFGKTRSTFESQNQRLRGVKSQEASENSEASRRRHRAVLETKVEVHQPAVAATVTSRAAEAETPAERKAGTSPRRATRESELQPCQHCQRSFRPAALDKHVKVCQSVFPSHDAKRNFQNSRDHRNAKGHTSEVESKVIKATNSTPPRVRPKVAEQAKEKVEREVPESTPMIFGGEQAEPGSPIWSLAFEAPEAAGEPARGLDVWEQEVEEAIQAMSEPIQDVSPTMTPGCPASASSSCLQERATLLERARLGMKMGQRPQQALFGSTSEVVLTADRYRALLPSSTESGATPADRMSQTVQAAPRFFQAGVSTHEVPQYRGVPDYLSRSQPIVPTVAEAPLSSRESRETNRRMEASPIRRLSFQSLGATDAGVSRASGLRLPVQRREPQQAQQGPPVEVRTVPRSQVSAKVKPGVGREDALANGRNTLKNRYLALPYNMMLGVGWCINAVASFLVKRLNEYAWPDLPVAARSVLQLVFQLTYFGIMSICVLRLDAYYHLKKREQELWEEQDLTDVTDIEIRRFEVELVANNLGDTLTHALAFVYGWGVSDLLNVLYYAFFMGCSSYSKCPYQQVWYYGIIVTVVLGWYIKTLSLQEYRSLASKSYRSFMITAMSLTVGWAWMNVCQVTTDSFVDAWNSVRFSIWTKPLCYLFMSVFVYILMVEIYYQILDELRYIKRERDEFHEAYPTVPDSGSRVGSFGIGLSSEATLQRDPEVPNDQNSPKPPESI